MSNILKDILDDHGSYTYKKEAKGYKVVPCPFCGSKRGCDISNDDNKPLYHCFACGREGNDTTLSRELGNYEKFKSQLSSSRSTSKPDRSAMSKSGSSNIPKSNNKSQKNVQIKANKEAKLSPKTNPAVVKEYLYKTSHQRPVQRVVRTEDKQFWQQFWDEPTKTWLRKKPEDFRGVPYNLPEILSAIERGETVAICEGEKDADNLTALGIVSSTNAGGAGNWPQDFGEFFIDADVLVFGDNDEPGKKHIKIVCDSLYRKAKSIRIPELPLELKEDISDWIEQGNTKKDLEEIVNKTKKWYPYNILSSKDIAMMEFESRQHIIPGILVKGTAMMIAGRGKIGKSWFALQSAISVASGGYILGKIKVQKAKVLYVSYEDTDDFMHERLEMLDVLNADFGENLWFMFRTQKLELDRGIPEVNLFIEDHKPDFVIIDTLAKCKPYSTGKYNIVEFDSLIADTFTRMALDYNVGILVVHHMGKTKHDKSEDKILGTTGFVNNFDGYITLEETKEFPDHMELKMFAKGKRIRNVNWKLDFDAYTQLMTLSQQSEPGVGDNEDAQATIELLRQNKEMTCPELSKELGKNPDNFRKALWRFVSKGLIQKRTEGNRNVFYFLSDRQREDTEIQISYETKPILGAGTPRLDIPVHARRQYDSDSAVGDWGSFNGVDPDTLKKIDNLIQKQKDKEDEE